MNETTQEPDCVEPASTANEDAAAPVVRETAVAYVTRPVRQPPPRTTGRAARVASPPAVRATPTDRDDLALLEAAADTGDGYAFLAAWRALDWHARPAEDLMRAIRWALAVGAHQIAYRLAVEGIERYPDHAELRKATRILNPPYIARHSPPDPGVQANTSWLDSHWHEYRGRWVAVRNGELLGTAVVLDDLVAQIGDIAGVLLAPVA